jgi:hypothetical protein
LIDKVEVRIPAQAQFTRKFGSLYREVRNNPKVDPFRGSRHYLYVGDLRAFGYSAILHIGCVRDKAGNHKVELLDTGVMSYAGMRNEIEQMFDLDARRLALMRVDLAADVRGVPVAWFVGHVRARWKQWVCDMGRAECATLEYARMGRQQVQTFYLGKRPNCFRIYDKLAEYHHQYRQLTRHASDAAELPSFEQAYGYPERGIVLTRVERQMGGGRVPVQIDTFGKLKASPEFNPFERLDFLAAGVQEPQIGNYGLNRFGFGMWLRSCAEDMGTHRLRALLNTHSGGHAGRLLKEYREFLPAEAGITAERLYATYQESVGWQLAA